jgi:hypothetical protein
MKRWYYIVKEDDSATIAFTTKKTAQQCAKHNLFYFSMSAKIAAKGLAHMLLEIKEKNS